MIFGCCEICESVICGPGYCLLVPADAATVLLLLTLVHKQTKNTKAKKDRNRYHKIMSLPHFFCSVYNTWW